MLTVSENNMTTQPRHTISIEMASEIINDGLPLVDFYIDGKLNLAISFNWEKEVIIENCIVEDFVAVGTEFEKMVKLVNSHFMNCNFNGSYFKKGLIIDNCIFDNYLDFQAGGHNKIGNPVILTNNNFKDFVNFFDCWYTGEISVCGNKFNKGTNIESKELLITFDIPPLIENNIGTTNFEKEHAFELEALECKTQTIPIFKNGGEEGFSKFFKNNLNKKHMGNIEGTVKVSFTVDATGKVKDPTILSSLSKEADKEVLSVVQMLEYIPGSHNGKNVEVVYSLPISFCFNKKGK